MSVRPAVVAGRFYPDSKEACIAQIDELTGDYPAPPGLPETIAGGIVPHAGWFFSGSLAAAVLTAIKTQQQVDTFVIFGAVHTIPLRTAQLASQTRWATPMGELPLDEALAEAIAAKARERLARGDDSHTTEHSIEVQLPLIRHLFPNASIVPISVPPVHDAPAIGEAAASAAMEAWSQSHKKVVFLGTTDLTHYGPSYYYTPKGTGDEAIRWAKERNDHYFLDLVLTMRTEELVEASLTYRSACGGGATAAAVAAAKHRGAEKGVLLGHRCSAEIMAEKMGQFSNDSVGYAGIVFG